MDPVFQKVLGKKKQTQKEWLSFNARNWNLNAISLPSQIWYKRNKIIFNRMIFCFSRHCHSFSISPLIIFYIICMCQPNCSGHLFGSHKINWSFKKASIKVIIILFLDKESSLIIHQFVCKNMYTCVCSHTHIIFFICVYSSNFFIWDFSILTKELRWI